MIDGRETLCTMARTFMFHPMNPELFSHWHAAMLEANAAWEASNGAGECDVLSEQVRILGTMYDFSDWEPEEEAALRIEGVRATVRAVAIPRGTVTETC